MLRKYLKENKHSGLHLALIHKLRVFLSFQQEYARVFVHGHYLFQGAKSLPRAKLQENCEHQGTDNVHKQISKHILKSIGGCCVYCPMFFSTCMICQSVICQSGQGCQLASKILSSFNSFWDSRTVFTTVERIFFGKSVIFHCKEKRLNSVKGKIQVVDMT